ncbi:MAG: deoxyribodipyrimidine photo-lyase [Halanaerobiales bacterium]
MIAKERIKSFNKKKIKKRDYVLYWVQAAQRADNNQALEYAINKANKLGQPLLALFVINDNFPEGNLRHYHFMLEGLLELKEKLAKKDIKLIITRGNTPKAVSVFSRKASLVVVDGGYLRITRRWRNQVAERIDCPLLQVETNLVVPVETASNKEEYAAYTLRPKINDKKNHFIKDIKKHKLKHKLPEKTVFNSPAADGSIEILTLKNKGDINNILKNLSIDDTVKAVKKFRGGQEAAHKLLQQFMEKKLDKYHKKSNDPVADCTSYLSPYLHFGHISPVYIANSIGKTESTGKEEFLEQLIVRRELSFNFIYYNPDYDQSLKSILPEWAYNTLTEHSSDSREYIYSKEEFEKGNTHDKYWNAAQREMKLTAYMHGYMRMYWGKKILEWSETPRQAVNTTRYLNNKYNLDGRGANAHAGIAWCFGKHDRAWAERDIYGKVRYMSTGGLERKFDIDKYVQKINNLEEENELI